MNYRRSVVLGIRTFRKMIGLLLLFYVVTSYFEVGPTWLRGRHEPTLLGAVLAFELFLSFTQHRLSDEPQVPVHWQPNPAASGTATVVLTGIAAAVATGWDAHGLSEMIVPIAILISTAVPAPLVYRFAKRNADRIGEARFKTTEV